MPYGLILAFVLGWGMNGILDYALKVRASNLKAEVRRLTAELDEALEQLKAEMVRKQ